MMHVLMHNGLIEQGVLDGVTMMGCYLAGQLLVVPAAEADSGALMS